MSAIDFLPLISGAAVDELIQLLKGNRQLARLNCLMEWQQLHGSSDLFLHSGKAQQFLEILYLKLSFLGDVARILLTSGAAPIPADISAAIDCIWINLPTHNSLLPSYWNFDINLFTFGSCGKYTDNLPISHPSQACYCLGIIWFFALLRNRKQSIHTVKEALKQILNRPAETFLENEFPVFAPENIFWNPDAHQPTDILNEWRVIWAHSLTLGKRLLQGNCSEKIDAGAENVFTDLEKIRQNIKQYLFYGEMATGTALPKQTADAEIHRILSGMLEKWKVNIPTPPPPQHSREETLTETVILSKNAGAGFSKNVGAAAKKTYPSGRTEEVLQETVILKTKTTPSITSKNTQKPHTPMGESAADEKNDMPETLILKPSYNKTDNKKNE